MTTKQPDYSVQADFGNLVEKHRQLPFKRFLDLIEGKLNDLNDMLLKPTPYDQGPGRQIPYCIPVWFGPLPLTTARRGEAGGFEGDAVLANPFIYTVPKNGDILVNRDSTVRIKSLNAYGFVNWGYKSVISSAGTLVTPTSVVNPQGVGDILDPVGPNPGSGLNGGAMPLDFFGGTFSTLAEQATHTNLPNIAFEVELYDKIRGRRMHDGRLPVEMFQGGRFGHRKTPSDIVWSQGSRIEPRLYVTEIRMGDILNAQANFDAASVKAWVCLVFKGVANLEVPNV